MTRVLEGPEDILMTSWTSLMNLMLLNRFLIQAIDEKRNANKEWLPWFGEVPNIPDKVVIRAHEAATVFCEGILPPCMSLAQHTPVSPSDMDNWVLTLLDTKHLHKQEELTEIYPALRTTAPGEEEPLLEQLLRVIVCITLEPLMERSDEPNTTQNRFAEIIPEILYQQYIQSPERLTFRRSFELHYYLSLFR